MINQISLLTSFRHPPDKNHTDTTKGLKNIKNAVIVFSVKVPFGSIRYYKFLFSALLIVKVPREFK